MPLSVKGPKDGEGDGEGEGEGELQQSRRERGSDGGNESPVVEEDDDLEPTIEVIHIPSSSTKTTNRTNSAAARLSYSPDVSRGQTDEQQQQQQQQQQLKTEDTQVRANKWKKLKTGLSRSTKLIGRRLRPGGGRSEKNVVHEICIQPSIGLNGECFGECEKKDDEKEEEKVEKDGGRKAKGGRKGRRGGKGKGKGLGLSQHHRSDSDDSLVFASRVASGATSSRFTPSVESSSNKKTIIDESIVIYDADYDGQL